MANPVVDKAILADLLTANPGLPKPNPTQSCWQQPPHALSETRSATLLSTTDILIIGSGITGTSVAKFLLEGDSQKHVTVLEARTLCSGATGRNGGQVIAFGAGGYSEMKKSYGGAMALKMIRFFWRTCEEVLKEAARYAEVESEVRRVTRVRGFYDGGLMEEVRASVQEFEEDWPEERGRYRFLDGEGALKELGLHGLAGAALFDAGALWPYRFIMSVWKQLQTEYSSRLSLEANTQVTKVEYTTSQGSTHAYTVYTPRGTIRATHVVHCTNGYSSHLLPSIRGRIFPKRGTMSVQAFENGLPNQGTSLSWNFHHPPRRYDEQTEAVVTGYYYMQQNPRTGHFFLGGDAQDVFGAVTADDTSTAPVSVQNLQKVLPEFFGGHASSELISSWTGIMGYTADSLPLVGKLPKELTEREGEGEWIAAGFNGGGMSQCWMAGQAVVCMILGEDVSGWFPETFELGEERLKSRLTVKNAMKVVDYLLLKKEDGSE